MSLRAKTLLVIWATLFLVIAVLYAGVRTAVLRSFGRLERMSVRQSVRRLERCLQGELRSFAALTGRRTLANPLVQAVLNDPDKARAFMADWDIALAAVIDSAGRPRYADAQPQAGALSAWRSFVNAHPQLWSRSPRLPPIAGLAKFHNAYWILTARVRPAPGAQALLLARSFSSAVVDRLNAAMRLQVAPWGWDHPHLPEDFQRARAKLSLDKPVWISPLSGDIAAGYWCAADIDNQPAMILRVTQPRPIQAHARGALRMMVCSLVITGAALALTTWLLLERLVLWRVRRMNQEVMEIADHASSSARIHVDGSDELAQLARSLNSMLFALERAQRNLRESEDRLRVILDAAQAGIVITDAARGAVVDANPAALAIMGAERVDVIGRPWTDFVEPAHDSTAALRVGEGQIELHTIKARGEERSVLKTSRQIRIRGREHIIESFVDITERRRAEAELARARRREAEIGWRIQETLLLGKPPQELDGLRVAAHTQPSQQVDGDFYDFLAHSPQCIDILVGDVVGKGVPAALLGAAAKAMILRAFSQLASARAGLPPPEAIVQTAHDAMVDDLIRLDRFVTLCYLRIDLPARRLTLVDCGHTKTLHFHADSRRIDCLKSDNVPLGWLPDERYEALAESLAPGDVIVAYSDGFTEARNAKREMFGEERLIECVRRFADLDAEEIVRKLHQAVAEFVQSDTFADDVTCVAVKIEREPAQT